MEQNETVLPPGKSRKDPVIFLNKSETTDTFTRKFADLINIFAL
jgi:hypothetical protein